MNQRPPDVPSGADTPDRRKMQRVASATLYAVMVVLAIWVIRDFVPAIAWACVIAIALWPAFHRVEQHDFFKGRTTLIATVLTIAIGLLFLLPVGIGIAQAANEAHDVIEWLRTVHENGIPVPDFVQHLPFGAAQIGAWWEANLAQPLRDSPAMKGLHGDAVVTFGRHFGARAAHALMLFGFMLVTLFVIFQAGPRLSGSLMKGVQRAFGHEGLHLVERMAAAVRGTVSGLVVVGIGEGALLFVAYMLTGVPHAALLGFVTAIAAMLPFCAPVVFCGAALWLFIVQGAIVPAIALAVFGFIVVFVAEHFVRPMLIGNSTRLPFLLVLFGILGGAETFGLLGLFVGPALMTVLMVLWTEWIER
ncbi:AI-2E family transporter [Paraburkholderia phymatum]|uniref:AI-2E family transporter n=1 Tax=Paraburkholderia phymatum TaxID=148447 RepID=A0ACC6TWS5_9BURK